MATTIIESVSVARKKTAEASRVASLIPGDIRQKSEKFIMLLEDYYQQVVGSEMPTEQIASITQFRDIDSANLRPVLGENPYLDNIQREIAAAIPKNIVVDKIKFYKNILQYYVSRGSFESIALFFKILFNDAVEVYLPYNDVLIPSSGVWTAGTYGSYNRGFLSNSIKLQDSYYYQKFSYVVKTGNDLSQWANIFKRLIHPAGFIFFGNILILIEATRKSLGLAEINSRMPDIQPGMAALEDLALRLYGALDARATILAYYTILVESSNGNIGQDTRLVNDYLDKLHFFDPTPMRDYEQWIIGDVTPGSVGDTYPLNSSTQHRFSAVGTELTLI